MKQTVQHFENWQSMNRSGFEMTPDMMTMMSGFTVLRLLTMARGMMNAKFTKEDLLKLNRIKQPVKKQ